MIEKFDKYISSMEKKEQAAESRIVRMAYVREDAISLAKPLYCEAFGPASHELSTLKRSLSTNGWTIASAGTNVAGQAWAIASHAIIKKNEEKDGLQNDILFILQEEQLLVFYDSIFSNKIDHDNPPGAPVKIDVSSRPRRIAVNDAIKTVNGRLASELYNRRRENMSRTFIPGKSKH